MTKLESAIIGYMAGAIVGGLSLLFLIAYILWKNGDFVPPEWYSELYHSIETQYHQPHPTLFEVAFIFGLLSGLGGGGTAVNSANNRRKEQNK